MKIAILGTGTWGTALGQLLCDNGHDVMMYGISKEEVQDIAIHHKNITYFPKEVELPQNLKASLQLEEVVLGAEIIVLAVPTFAIRDVLKKIKPFLHNRPYLVSVAKGFDPVTHDRMSEVIRQEIDASLRQEVVSLIGPGHAEEVVLRMLTCVTSTSLCLETAKVIQEAFSNDYFRVYTQTDEIGAEYGVALKNGIAIASGILTGIGLGDNARAALVTRGLAEMVRFGTTFGGEERTYLGFTGLGDLMVTCNSIHSRNFQAGYAIGKANGAKEFLIENKKTVEGIRTVKVVYEMAKEKGIEMPIIEATYRVLYEDVKPMEAIHRTMRRTLKQE